MTAKRRSASTPGVLAGSLDEEILQVRGIDFSYGKRRILSDVSFAVQRHSITAIIGPNGAGKSTLFDILTGFAHPSRGSIRYNGQGIVDRPPHRIAALGMVRTFQHGRIVRRLSVIENVMLGAPAQPGENPAVALVRPRHVRSVEHGIRSDAAALLERLNLSHLADSYAGVLSGGQRKLVALARALMLRPELLLLDEPMAGVNPSLAGVIMRYLLDVRTEQGMTIMFVEHDMHVVGSMSDTVIVMDAGGILLQGTPDAVRKDPSVIDAYLGGVPQ